jgi:ketosteroid isomerase-like protein
MNRLAFASLVLLLSLMSGSSAASEADVSAVTAASRAWDEAYAAGDAARLVDRYDDAAVSMPPGLPALSTKAAIAADFKTFFASNSATHRTLDADRRISGEYAIERARYEAAITPKNGGATIKESGKHIVVYRRQANGAWKVLWEIWNSDG